MSFASEAAAARACTLCAPHLRDGVRPVFRGKPSARLMLIGQAPGRRVHESGVPWDDPSGDRLRDWLGLDRDAFYDER
ncbi:MAG: uracil-DNA glycosylase family protein, partial [Tagaea sp.]|nr:uracil-DNA glycosylase family protein [Tagaea sp.]